MEGTGEGKERKKQEGREEREGKIKKVSVQIFFDARYFFVFYRPSFSLQNKHNICHLYDS